MKKLMLGFLFLFLNINVGGGAVAIDILPAFVGYLFLCAGLAELSWDHPPFEKLRPICLVAAGVELVFWVLNCLGLTALLTGVWMGIFEVVAVALMAISLFILYRMIAEFQKIEAVNGTELGTSSLKKAWLVLVGCEGISIALGVYSLWSGILEITKSIAFTIAVIGLVSAIGAIAFLICFNHTKNAYEKMKAVQAIEQIYIHERELRDNVDAE